MEIALTEVLSLADPEAALVRRMAEGDEGALRALYASHGRRLYAFALRLTEHPATAEEVLQDSLLAAWQGARSYRGEARVTTWLLGIVHRQALNATRRKRLYTAPLEEASDLADGTAGPEARAEAADRRRALQAALGGLSREHRAVVELVLYQGLSLAEAAQVCGCPVGTVKSRLSYARAHLRKSLGRAGQQGEGSL